MAKSKSPWLFSRTRHKMRLRSLGRRDIPLDQPVIVKYVQYSEEGEVIHRAGKTDETQLQMDLLVRIAQSKIVQEPFSVVFWPVVAAIVIFLMILALFQ